MRPQTSPPGSVTSDVHPECPICFSLDLMKNTALFLNHFDLVEEGGCVALSPELSGY